MNSAESELTLTRQQAISIVYWTGVAFSAGLSSALVAAAFSVNSEVGFIMLLLAIFASFSSWVGAGTILMIALVTLSEHLA
jgi:hypothetical protein